MKNFVLYLLIICCIVLNSTTTSNIIILFLLSISFVINNKNLISEYFFKLILFFGFVVSFLLSFSNLFDNNQFIRWVELILLFISFPINFKPKKNFYIALIVVFLYLFCIQITNALGLFDSNIFLEKYYPIDNNVWSSNSDFESGEFSTFSNRLAGIYYNPNIMGQTILLLYLLFLTNSNIFFSKKIIFIFSILCFFSIMLSGSRTAMITFGLIYFFTFKNDILKYFKYYFLFAFLPLLILLNTGLIGEIRAFYNLTGIFTDEGDSGSIKISMLTSYFNDLHLTNIKSILFLLFGNMSWDRQFDSDIGYVISFFGLIGTMLISIFFLVIYRRTKDSCKHFFLVFLICIGATIIMNFRFAILLFTILSLNDRVNIALNKT